MSEAYVIEKGVPIPPATHGRKKGGANGYGVRAALRHMEPGDSIVVEQKHRFSLSGHCEHVGCKIVSRSQDDGSVRVWVTERSTPVQRLTEAAPSVIDESTAGIDPHSCLPAQAAPSIPLGGAAGLP